MITPPLVSQIYQVMSFLPITQPQLSHLRPTLFKPVKYYHQRLVMQPFTLVSFTLSETINLTQITQVATLSGFEFCPPQLNRLMYSKSTSEIKSENQKLLLHG